MGTLRATADWRARRKNGWLEDEEKGNKGDGWPELGRAKDEDERQPGGAAATDRRGVREARPPRQAGRRRGRMRLQQTVGP